MKGFIELSLKGSDVGGPDPGENVEEGRIQTKRKKDVNANDESSDEGEQVLKKLRTGMTIFCDAFKRLVCIELFRWLGIFVLYLGDHDLSNAILNNRVVTWKQRRLWWSTSSTVSSDAKNRLFVVIPFGFSRSWRDEIVGFNWKGSFDVYWTQESSFCLSESDDENCPESEIEDEDEVPEFSSDEEVSFSADISERKEIFVMVMVLETTNCPFVVDLWSCEPNFSVSRSVSLSLVLPLKNGGHDIDVITWLAPVRLACRCSEFLPWTGFLGLEFVFSKLCK